EEPQAVPNASAEMSEASTTNGHTNRGDQPELEIDELASVIALTSTLNDDNVGEYLKKRYIEAKVLPTILDLFFDYPWNSFLHNVVYDILQTALTLEKSFHPLVVLDLFTTGEILERIIRARKQNDENQYTSITPTKLIAGKKRAELEWGI